VTNIENEINLESIIGEDKISQYSCNLCDNVVSKIYSCVMGHAACYNCLSKFVSQHGTCPTCRTPMKLDTMCRNLFYEQILSSEIVKCPYYINCGIIEEGTHKSCDSMKYSELVEKHAYECHFRRVRCACDKEILLFEQTIHQDTCPKTIYQCTSCQTEFERKDAELHFSSCGELLIDCSRCSFVTKRKNMKNHLDHECMNTFISCTNGGCYDSFKRSELPKHISDDCKKTIISCPFAELGCPDLFERSKLRDHLILYDNHTKYIESVLKTVNLLKEKNQQLEIESKRIVLLTNIITLDRINSSIDWSSHKCNGNIEYTFIKSLFGETINALEIKLQNHFTSPSIMQNCKYTVSLHDKSHKELAIQTGVMLGFDLVLFIDICFTDIGYLKVSFTMNNSN